MYSSFLPLFFSSSPVFHLLTVPIKLKCSVFFPLIIQSLFNLPVFFFFCLFCFKRKNNLLNQKTVYIKCVFFVVFEKSFTKKRSYICMPLFFFLLFTTIWGFFFSIYQQNLQQSLMCII